MYQINEDLSIYATRGDIVLMDIGANDKDGKPYTFMPGDIVRIKVYQKKKATNVLLEKDFPVTASTQSVQIYLSGNETKFDEPINKPTTYWYEVVLNEDTEPQTIIGYDPEEGARLFILLPEGATDEDVEDYEPGEDERYMDYAALVREMAQLTYSQEQTHKAVAELHVTPQMYGAIGDGVADDTEAFKKAIEKSTVVFVPKGVYFVTETLVFPAGSVLRGESRELSVIYSTADVAIKSEGNFRIENVQLKGDGTNVAIAAYHTNQDYTDMKIQSFGVGVTYNQTDYAGINTFNNVYFREVATCVSYDHLFNHVKFTNCIAEKFDCFLNVRWLEAVSFIGCIFEKANDGNLIINHTQSAYAFGVTFIGCYFENFAPITGKLTRGSMTFTGNWFYGACLFFNDGSDATNGNVKVTFIGNHFGTPTEYDGTLLAFSDACSVVFINNEAHSEESSTIDLHECVTGNKVSFYEDVVTDLESQRVRTKKITGTTDDSGYLDSGLKFSKTRVLSAFASPADYSSKIYAVIAEVNDSYKVACKNSSGNFSNKEVVAYVTYVTGYEPTETV